MFNVLIEVDVEVDYYEEAEEIVRDIKEMLNKEDKMNTVKITGNYGGYE